MGVDPKVVVIGSGPAGAMAAHELVTAGVPTVMLESGLSEPTGLLLRVMSRNLWRRKGNAYQERGGLHRFSGDPETCWWYHLGPGGLSNQWTGAVPRFAPEDFCEGERLHERYRWPVTYSDLVPYYERAENLLQVSGDPSDVPSLPACRTTYPARLPHEWQRVAQRAAAQGQGLTVLPLADGAPWLLLRRGTAFNSYANIVLPLTTSGRLELLKGAHALQLVWSGAKRRVTSVLYYDRLKRSTHEVPAAAVVVACGALHSTKLLFDSACPDFSRGLGNASGVLGRYLHDHAKEWWVADLARPITRLTHAAYLTRRPWTDSPPLIGASWTINVSSAKEKLMSFTPLKGSQIGVQVLGTTIPADDCRAEPDAERRDEFGLPVLDIDIRYDAPVLSNMIEARRHLCNIMEEAGYPCSLRPVAAQLHPGSSVHYGGTVRMHESPKYGVLDAWNRVHDVPNVLVADASCFTTGPEKNPTLTVMALAARAAHRLVEDLKRGDHRAL